MSDRENVIKNLEICTSGYCKGCTYHKPDALNFGCWDKLMKVAAELLKEQAEQIERLEHDLAVTEGNLAFYINGND